MSLYEVGQRVKMVSTWPRNAGVGHNSAMDRYLGTVMTIRLVDCGQYYMEEDENETTCNTYHGWVWSERLIEGLAEIKDEHHSIRMCYKAPPSRDDHFSIIELKE